MEILHKDLLNPVRATSTDKCNAIYFGNEKVFTLTEVAPSIRELKSGKAAGKDKGRLKILKALNREEDHWLQGCVT